MEIVFEYGFCWPATGNNKAYHITPGPSGIVYTVNIQNNGVSVPGYPLKVTNPHNWFTRWRWQSTKRPIVNTPAQIVAKKWWFKMSSEGLPTPAPLKISGSNWGPYTYNILGNAGVCTSMGTTGGRCDIGIISEWSGQWLLNPNASTEAMLRATGEASGSIPNRLRDENTGACLSSVTYPGANYYGQNGGSGYGPFIRGNGQAGGPASVWGTDVAHYPDLTSILFKATFDPYTLENLQFDCGDVFWETQYFGGGANALIQVDQIRGFAWGFRTLVNAWHCAYLAEQNGPLPSWILPSTHYETLLNANWGWLYGSFLNQNSPTPNPTTSFGAIIRVGTSEPWQQCWLTSAIAMAVLFNAPNNAKGVATIANMLSKLLSNNTIWCTGTSIAEGGWPTGYGIPYANFYDFHGASILTPKLLPPGDAYIQSPAGLWKLYSAAYAPVVIASISGKTLTVTAVVSNGSGSKGDVWYNCIGGAGGQPAFPVQLWNGSTHIANITKQLTNNQ